VVGVPLGAYVIRRLDAETFRRICMSFDAWVVGFGLSRVLIELNLIESPWAYSVMVVTILIDIYLLYIFFTRKAASKRSQTPWAPLTPSEQSARHDRILDVTDERFGPLSRLLGYIITILAVGMLLYTVSPAIRLSPSANAPCVMETSYFCHRFGSANLADF